MRGKGNIRTGTITLQHRGCIALYLIIIVFAELAQVVKAFPTKKIFLYKSILVGGVLNLYN